MENSSPDSALHRASERWSKFDSQVNPSLWKAADRGGRSAIPRLRMRPIVLASSAIDDFGVKIPIEEDSQYFIRVRKFFE